MEAPSVTHIGQPRSRVEGRLKVTGGATYAAEYAAPNLLHGYIVSATVPAGRIKTLDLHAASKVDGVVQIFTHENCGKAAWLDRSWRDEVAPPGHPFRPLHSDRILFDGQPIALVVAESFEAARDAAAFVRAEYETEIFATDLERNLAEAYVPPKKRSGIPRPPEPRGDAERAFSDAPFNISRDYRLHAEHHNPMEMFATTCVVEADGTRTVYDKTQGSQNTHGYITSVFGLKDSEVRVVNRYVGGAFGSGLRPQHQVFFAVMASLELKRSVRVALTRSQMFHIGYRPDTFQTVSLAADRQGLLQSVMHDAVAATSMYEDYQESVVNWSGLLYRCDNVKLSYQLAKLNTSTPCDMRAPGAAVGVTALECAMDELSYEVGIDPLEFRRRNYAHRDDNDDKEFTSKALLSCYDRGAEVFGWARRQPQPRAMREGKELVGWGVASGSWEAFLQKTEAAARLTLDGRLAIATAASDIGTGTWTILTQIAADGLGFPMEAIDLKIGELDLPASPVQGGSWTAASSGAAVDAACTDVKTKLFGHAQKMANSPFAKTNYDDVEFVAGHIRHADDWNRSLSIREVMEAADLTEIEGSGKVGPDLLQMMTFASYAHSAVFAEVKVDQELNVVRVTRVVCATAAGRILNPKTARSQILGGVVMGIGMALHEEGMTDHRLGRIMNANLAEYHIPAHADIADIEVIFIDEKDEKVSPLGVKGLGEIGIVGTAAAVANAIYHATGTRVRDFPITIDKLFEKSGDAVAA